MSHVKQLLLASAVAMVATGAAAAPTAQEKIRVGGNGAVFPESITSTADGSVFTSSVGLGRVFRIAPGARQATAWSARPASGPQSVLGVQADENRSTLWACYSDMALAKGDTGKPAVLKALDLQSGKVKQSYPLPALSFCNDIALGADGDVYVTDTHGGRVLRLPSGTKRLQTWFEDKQLVGVDGIARGDDGALYLTNVKSNDLFKLPVARDGKPGSLAKLKLSEPVKGPDGLRADNHGHFYLSENAAGKVDEVNFSGDQATLKTIATGYDAPTSTTTHGDTLYVVEAKIQRYGKGTKESPFYVYAGRAPAD